MTQLYLPPSVMAAERLRFAADIDARVDRDDPVALRFTRLLQAHDRRLIMVRAKDTIAPGTPLKPGYYHLIVRNDNAPLSVFPVEGANGEYVEPTSRVFTRLAAGDMHNPAVYREMVQKDRRRDAEVERDKKLRKEQRRDHLRDNVNAATRTSVSMNRDARWTQNASGRLPDEKEVMPS